jgi:hypothetical protein
MKKNASLLLLLTTVFSASLSAETLVAYDFDVDLAPTSVASGLSAGPVATGRPFTGLTAVGGGRSAAAGDIFTRSQSSMRSDRLIRTTAEAAIQHGTFFEFTLTPDKGKALDLEGFSALVGGQVLGGSKDPVSGFTAHYFLRVSLDNYTNDLATGTQAVAGLEGGDRSNAVIHQELRAHLTGPAFRGITAPVTFRLYFYIDTEATHFCQVFRMDDFKVVGRVVAR